MIVLGAPRLGFHGGVERHVFDLAGGLRQRGHRVALVHGPGQGRDADEYARAFDDVAEASLAGQLVGEASVVYLHKLDEAALGSRVPSTTRLVVAVHDHDLTCVRSHRYLPLTSAPCDRAPGVTCVAHGCVAVANRCARFGVSLRDPFALVRSTRALATRTPLIACSTFLRQSLIDAGVRADRVDVVRPVPPDDPSDLVPVPDAPIVAFVGQVIRGKGLDLLLEAVAPITGARLLVAGTGNGLEAEKNRAARLGLRDRVEFLGAIPPREVRGVYDRARVVAVPSRWPEPFGMIGVEAMRRARVTVGARHGGIPEWLDDTITGLAFRPGDVADLTSALRRALSNDRYASMANAAYARATSELSFARMMDRVEVALGIAGDLTRRN